MENDLLSFDRRAAIKKCASITGIPFIGAITLSAIFANCEKDTLKSTDKSTSFDISGTELANVGGAIKKVFGENNSGRPVMILRMTQNEFVVLTTVCTHQGCEVDLPKTAGENIVCQCHGSEFSSKDGSVIKSPASSPLQKFKAEFDGIKTLKIFF